MIVDNLKKKNETVFTKPFVTLAVFLILVVVVVFLVFVTILYFRHLGYRFGPVFLENPPKNHQ